MDEYLQTLTKLGLSDKEAKVYFATLKLGVGSAQAIARIAGIKRPTTYVILDDLRQKGLILKMPDAKQQRFSAVSPQELVVTMKRNLSSVEKILPELMQTYRGNTPTVRTAHFEGLEGLKVLMEYGFKEAVGKEIVGFYAIAPEHNQELNKYFKEWNEKRFKLGISLRGLAPVHESLKSYRENDKNIGATFKSVPYEQFSSEIAIDATNEVVRIHDYKNLQGVVIENKEVAKTVKEIFEMLWSRI